MNSRLTGALRTRIMNLGDRRLRRRSPEGTAYMIGMNQITQSRTKASGTLVKITNAWNQPLVHQVLVNHAMRRSNMEALLSAPVVG